MKQWRNDNKLLSFMFFFQSGDSEFDDESRKFGLNNVNIVARFC